MGWLVVWLSPWVMGPCAVSAHIWDSAVALPLMSVFTSVCVSTWGWLHVSQWCLSAPTATPRHCDMVPSMSTQVSVRCEFNHAYRHQVTPRLTRSPLLFCFTLFKLDTVFIICLLLPGLPGQHLWHSRWYDGYLSRYPQAPYSVQGHSEI